MAYLRRIVFFQVLGIDAFRNLWFSQLLSQVFLNLLFFSLMLRIYEMTKSNSAVSVVVFLVTIPNIFLGALAGVLVDRWGRKPVMFFCHFLRALAVLAFLLSSETLAWVYILVFLISVVTQFFFPAEAGIIHEIVTDEDKLLTANSLFSITFFASVILGNVLAGPFLRVFGPNLTFLIIASAFLLSSFFSFKLPGPSVFKIKRDYESLHLKQIFLDFLGGVDHLYHTPIVRRSIFFLGASQITIGILGVIAPGFADRILGLPVTDVSVLVMAPAAAGMAIGAISLSQLAGKAKPGNLIRAGFFAAPVFLIIFSFVDKIAGFWTFPLALLIVIVLLALGAANAFIDIPANTVIQQHTPHEVRSRVYGVVSSVIGVSSILPIVISGALADIFGVRLVMLATGIVLLGLAIRYNSNNYASNPS